MLMGFDGRPGPGRPVGGCSGHPTGSESLPRMNALPAHLRLDVFDKRGNRGREHGVPDPGSNRLQSSCTGLDEISAGRSLRLEGGSESFQPAGKVGSWLVYGKMS